MKTTSLKSAAKNPSDAERGKLERLREKCRADLEKTPDSPVYIHMMGLVESQLGRHGVAIKWLKKALALQPNSPDIMCHYGLVLMEQSKYSAAIKVFRRTAEANPKHAEAFYHLGNACKILGDLNEAIKAYTHALALDPQHVETLNNFGTLLSDQKRHGEAALLFHRAVIAKPDYVLARNNLGVSLAALDMLDEAQQFYHQTLRLKPDYPEVWNNLGVLFRLRGEFEKSIVCFRKALELRPAYADAWNNIGNALKDCGRMDESIFSYQEAIRLKDTADNRHNLALALLAAGRLQDGWREYETRWKCGQLSPGFRSFTQPQWQGEEARGKIVLLHAEQGFGDSLQFCRYASLAAARGLRVVLEVQPQLVRLMKSLAGVETVIARGQPFPEFDLHCPLLSLPFAFDTKIETIPAGIPYLAAGHEAVSAWHEKLLEHEDYFKVGLVWAGQPRRHTPDLAATDRRRSMSPDHLMPLADMKGIRLFSLQKSEPLAPEALHLIDHMNECRDFADTAALIANLDLVISVDTAVAHLAASIGKPVWLLNRFDSCWRWLRHREDTPWYPSMRIFRQPSAGDWQSVIANVRDALSDQSNITISSHETVWPPAFLSEVPQKSHTTHPRINF